MIGAFEQTMLAATVFVIMLGMGASLSPRDFGLVLRRPHALGVGLVSQYGFMPLAGLSLTLAFDLPDPVAVGVLILSCMPGGATSNMFTYFSRGNLALSVAMTVTSTLVGVLLIPVLLSVYAQALDLRIPRENIVATLLLLLFPVAIGMALRALNARAGSAVEMLGSALGIVFIVFIVLSWLPRNADFLLDAAPTIHVAAVMLGIVGFIVGYFFSLAVGLTPRTARTVALETGIQNAPLAIAIVALSFAAEDQQPILAVMAMYSLFIVITSTAVTLLFRFAPAPATPSDPGISL
jgi:BASS family bile acid:Na+ symporter